MIKCDFQDYFSDDEGEFGFMTTLSEPLQVLLPLECLWIFQFAPFVNFKTMWPVFHFWHHAQKILGALDFDMWKLPELGMLLSNS